MGIAPIFSFSRKTRGGPYIKLILALLTLWGPVDDILHPDFEVGYLTAQMELDQVFDHFWHLQAETFSLKKEIIQKYFVLKKF